MTKVAALILVAVLTGYGFHVLAQGRPDVRQTVAPIGTSSSNGISVVWFYESTTRNVYACRTGHGSGDAVDCKGSATLP
jgi:hypothetical protein